MLNEYYQRSLQLPEGLEVSDSILRESFPAAIRIGGDMVSQGNMLGAELIQSAQLAFVDGMIASAWVGATIAPNKCDSSLEVYALTGDPMGKSELLHPTSCPPIRFT